MKKATIIVSILAFFGLIIYGIYYFSESKIITEWPKSDFPETKEGEYDVIVVGSDPEGIAAAIGSARSGAKTLLLGKEDGPGGLLTYGMLNTLDMNYNNKNDLLTRGVFQEFFKAIGKTESFDVARAKAIFSEMIANEENIEYRTNRKFVEPILEENKIIGVIMEDFIGNKEEIKGKRVIDATQDGDVCAASGVPYYIGMEDINISGNMAATLVIKVGGVEWAGLGKDISRYQKEVGNSNDSGFNKSTAWGFGKWCYSEYDPIYDNMQLRGPNFGLQDDGTILINALQIFDVDGLNEESKALAMKQGKEEAENVVKHLKNKLNSFKDAYLIGVADDLYIRETRHIQGEYMLKASDVLGNRNFPDKIALSSYPIDIQATAKTNTGYVIGAPDQYSIPLRCVVPKKIDNLFIVGRAASYSSVAAGSARVVPTGMAVGEATGIAAVYTIYKDMTPRELTKVKSEELYRIFKKQNIYLPEYKGGDPNRKVEGYDKIKKLLNLGMLSGGYSNNYSFENSASVSALCNAMVNALQRGGNEKYNLATASSITKYYSNKKLTGGAAARLLAGFFGDYTEPEALVRLSSWDDGTYEKEKKKRTEEIESDCWEIAKEKGYFLEDFEKDEVLTYRHVYIIAVDAIERFIGRQLG